MLDSRTGEAKSFSLKLSWFNEDSSEMIEPVKVKQGPFPPDERELCIPAIVDRIREKDAKPCGIQGKQSKLKLVMPCREEKYIIRSGWCIKYTTS